MSKPYVVGIDIGGTNTVFGIVDARGSILASGSIKTQKYAEINDYVNDLSNELVRLLEQENVKDQIEGIGIGAPMQTILPVISNTLPTCRGKESFLWHKC